MQNWTIIRNHPIYRVAIWAALGISLVALWQMNASILSNPKYIPVDDFSHYWAAGYLNNRGKNPYNPIEVQKIRDTLTGTTTEYAEIPITWTPPWSLPFVMPFGLFNYPTSRLLWLIAHISIILVCANLCWKIYGGRGNTIYIGWIAGFIFGPTISVLEKGQITPWVLLGIGLFIYLTEFRKQPFLAGLAVLLITLKPQLFYLFWLALAFWVISQHAWKTAFGFLVSIVGAFLISMIFNPNVISQYLTAFFTYPPTDWATPTIGGYLRLLFGIDRFWLQFIPVFMGIIWFGYVWGKHRSTWVWSQRIPSLLLVSILTAPYAWTYDQVILLPVIFYAVALLDNAPKMLSFALWGLFIVINFLDLWLHRYYDDFWFGWLAPVLIFWFLGVLYATRKVDENKKLQDYPVS